VCESSTSLTGESRSDATDADAPPPRRAGAARSILAGPSVALCSLLSGEFSPGFLTGKERPKMSTTNNTTHDPDRSPPMKRF
jgi:hypothetical protein